MQSVLMSILIVLLHRKRGWSQRCQIPHRFHCIVHHAHFMHSVSDHMHNYHMPVSTTNTLASHDHMHIKYICATRKIFSCILNVLVCSDIISYIITINNNIAGAFGLNLGSLPSQPPVIQYHVFLTHVCMAIQY